MSFIQKLIERKTQATGSQASEHKDEDAAVNKASLTDSHAPNEGVVDTGPTNYAAFEAGLNDAPRAKKAVEPLSLQEQQIINEPEIDVQSEEIDVQSEIESDINIAAGIEDDNELDPEAEPLNIWDIDMDGEGEATPDAQTAQRHDSQSENQPEIEPQDIEPQTEQPVVAETPPEVSEIDQILQQDTAKSDIHAVDMTSVDDTQSDAPEIEDTQSAESTSAVDQPDEPVIMPTRVSSGTPTFIEPVATEPAPTIEPAPMEHATTEPTPAKRRVGRVKTRLLGFDHSNTHGVDLFDPNAAIDQVAQARYPVGWIVVVDGPGRGESFALQAGMSQIGRGEDQAIQLDFGDATISRNNHAAIVYDTETHKFLLGHGGKANVVRLNSKPLLSTEEMKHSDLIRIGETTMRLVALCSPEFNWEEDDSKGPDDVAIA